MAQQNKKKHFPGIFVVIAISFVIYLTVVTCVIMAHYKKSTNVNTNKNIVKV